mmetsp:Transcript_117470/g.292872  ORF Transcript_117470/g.292872 Transcript_117470/m.292872 type:complete len:432 (-) Transcript_117470:349-1644(-)
MALWITGSFRAAALIAFAVIAGFTPMVRAITSDTLQLAPTKSAAEAQATQLQASLVWKEVSPPNRDVFMSIGTDLGYGLPDKDLVRDRCNSGFMGAQFRAEGHHVLLWSMSGREEGQVVPISKHCHYDCFDDDCSLPNKRDFQCKRDDYKLSVGINYTFTLQLETQNASGAVWVVTMVSPDRTDITHPIEVGRVLFKDRDVSLPEDNCRVLGVDTYVAQEYWNPNQQEFTTRASWSAITFSGAMRPQDTTGSCQGMALTSLTLASGLPRAACKSWCMAEERCRFASYSSVEQDGHESRCMLFDRCEAKDRWAADKWWTYEKVDVPTLAAVAFTEECRHFRDQSGDDRTARASVHRLPGGPVELELDVGQDVKCVAGAGPRLLFLASARGAPHLARLGTAESATLALRGSAHFASALVARPKTAEGEPLMFP